MKNTRTLVYQENISRRELAGIVKAAGLPVSVLALCLYTISSFAAFGTGLVCPLSGAMWITGFFAALLVPSMRREVIRQTLITVTTYCVTLLALKTVIGIVSGVSAAMIAASFDQAVPAATGNAIPGYLQNILWFSAVLIPIGFMGMQGKRLLQFHRNRSLSAAFSRFRDIRQTGWEGRGL